MTLPITAFHGADLPSRALIDACVHCGFCLPSCPTYVLWGEEMDTPRGRIYLMKAALEGRAEMSSTFVGHFDACLGCMACVPSCPSGVQYGPLIEHTRAQIERQYDRPLGDRVFRSLLFALLPYPARLRIALAPLVVLGPVLRALERSGALNLLPRRVRSLIAVAPQPTARALFERVPEHTPASGQTRLTAGLLTGCVQRIAFSHVNRATIDVLAAEGCSVDAPGAQGCCGALALHAGNIDQAREFARHNIDVFEKSGVDRIVVNAAGCGSAMKDYGGLFAEDPAWVDRAREFSARVRDVSEVLMEIGEPRAKRHPIEATRVVYHDACHLAHAQGVRTQPRSLLTAIPGIELLSPPESEICCGSAGIYNLVQPEPAAQLGERKARMIAALKPDLIATGNPGCILQIAAAGARLGFNWRIVHPIELIDRSIKG